MRVRMARACMQVQLINDEKPLDEKQMSIRLDEARKEHAALKARSRRTEKLMHMFTSIVNSSSHTAQLPHCLAALNETSSGTHAHARTCAHARLRARTLARALACTQA